MNRFQRIFEAQKGALSPQESPRTYEWACRNSSTAWAAHDQRENEKRFPGGDGRRLQDGLAGGHLRDPRPQRARQRSRKGQLKEWMKPV